MVLLYYDFVPWEWWKGQPRRWGPRSWRWTSFRCRWEPTKKDRTWEHQNKINKKFHKIWYKIVWYAAFSLFTGSTNKFIFFFQFLTTLRSQIKGYSRLLIFRKFLTLPLDIWASLFINFQESLIRAYLLIKFEEKFQTTLLLH